MVENFISTFASIVQPAQGKTSEQVVAELTPEQLNVTDGQGSGLLIRLLSHRTDSTNLAAMALIERLNNEQILLNNNIGINALNVVIDSGNTEALRAIAVKIGNDKIDEYRKLLENSPEMLAAIQIENRDPDIADSTAAASPQQQTHTAARTAGS